MRECVACTVITKSHLAFARTLAHTLDEHNPNSKLFVLLADKVDGYLDPQAEPFHLIRLEDLADHEAVERMCFYYTPFELCCSLRGSLHDYMLNETSARSWVFLDSDIMVFNSLDDVFRQLEETSILLSPHRTRPADLEYVFSVERILMQGGVYNGGFLGLRRTDESRAFVSWFKERLIHFGLDEVRLMGFFVDQKWLDFVPLYFKDVSFLRHSGANLGHWNWFDRDVRKDGRGNITLDGQPLLFVHYSGWNISHPEKVSKHSDVYDEVPIPFWSEVSNAYKTKLLANGYQTAINYPYGFAHFQSGEPITLEMRRIYYDALFKRRMYFSEQQVGDWPFKSSPFEHPEFFRSRLRGGEAGILERLKSPLKRIWPGARANWLKRPN